MKKILFYSLISAVVIWQGQKLLNIYSENSRLHTELLTKSQEYEQLSKHAAKLEIKYSDAKVLEGKLNEKFAQERHHLEGRIKVLSNATFLIRERARKTDSSDISYSGALTKYVVNEIRFKDGPPVGYVLIFDDGRVVSRLYNHEIQVHNAISRNETSGVYSILAKADFILKSPSLKTDSPSWKNKPFPLTIASGTAYVDPTERNQLTPRIHWWAPHINGGFGFGAGTGDFFLRPMVDVSFAGYGVTKNDLNWKFLHLGVNTDTQLSDPGIHIIPFSYRFLPSFLSNSYVGPGVGKTKSSTLLILNLNVTF